jgi:hypothetical protein
MPATERVNGFETPGALICVDGSEVVTGGIRSILAGSASRSSRAMERSPLMDL